MTKPPKNNNTCILKSSWRSRYLVEPGSNCEQGTKQDSLIWLPSQVRFQKYYLVVGISQLAHILIRRMIVICFKDPGMSATKGIELRTSNALEVQQEKDATLSPLYIRYSQGKVKMLKIDCHFHITLSQTMFIL